MEAPTRIIAGESSWIEYRIDWSNIPEYCQTCRNTEYTKTCAQSGCGRTIRYKKTWSNIPNYCKRCQTKRDQGYTPGTCLSCGTLTWSPPGKIHQFCFDHKPVKPRFRHESNQSENRRFWNACRAAGLGKEETRDASKDFHNLWGNERMSFEEIKSWAEDWQEQN